MVKVTLSINSDESEIGDFESLSEVAVTGATGTATYRLDPIQDVEIKVTVDGVTAKMAHAAAAKK